MMVTHNECQVSEGMSFLQEICAAHGALLDNLVLLFR
jgi:hypothetical protein